MADVFERFAYFGDVEAAFEPAGAEMRLAEDFSGDAEIDRRAESAAAEAGGDARC